MHWRFVDIEHSKIPQDMRLFACACGFFACAALEDSGFLWYNTERYYTRPDGHQSPKAKAMDEDMV